MLTEEEFIQKYHISLNEQQLAAMRSVDGPVLLLAVPGSGKTTVLVTRLGYMLFCRGIAPERILTLTYTVAATKDMERRFYDCFGSTEGLSFRTINSICARIIAYYGRKAGKTVFRLEDNEKNLTAMLSEIYQRVERSFPTESELQELRTSITYIKNQMLNETEIRALEAESDLQLFKIYEIYVKELRRRELMDFDDQMVYALRILRISPETLQYFQTLYPYICVDEAQDTSRIQHAIIALLARRTENLFMVGDEDQSIYGFRAAFPEALLSFEKAHPGARVLLMEKNYRSEAAIVKAADRFIQKNTLRHAKHMRPVRQSPGNVRMIPLRSRNAQYTYLLKVAEDCEKRARQWAEAETEQPLPTTAVLYRDHESALPLIDLLERSGISYRMKNADLGFFTNRLVTDIRNIIQFALNPADTELFLRIYSKLQLYMKKKDAEQLCQLAELHEVPVLEAAGMMQLPVYTKKNLQALRREMKALPGDTAEHALTRILMDMGYNEYLNQHNLKRKKLAILRMLARQEKRPGDLLQRLDDLQQLLREKDSSGEGGLVLSTIHSSKGLEYDTVFLLDVEDGIFPENVPMPGITMDPAERAAYEEERRLFYVGITRARQSLQIFSEAGKPASFTRELMKG